MIKYSWYACIFFITSSLFSHQFGITYRPWSGRLGDNIFYIGRCLVLSDKYKIPFYYKPFEHSDQFCIHSNSNQLTPEIEKTFSKKITINHEVAISDILKREKENTLIIVHFNTKVYDRFYSYCKKHPAFYKHIKEFFTPLSIPQHAELPTDTITVALHVRKGSFIDGPLSSKQEYSGRPPTPVYKNKRRIPPPPRYISDKRFPDKFPPDQYYIDAIKMLSNSVQNQPLYIYIFTDYAYPQAIVEKYKDRVDLPNITWADQATKANYKESIIHDFYFMAQFDCIIRPNSFFSMAAQIIGNAKRVLYPAEHEWQGNVLKIKKIAMVKRGELSKK